MKQYLRFRGCYCPKRIQPIYLVYIVAFLLTVGGKGAFAQRSLSGTVVDTTGSAITGATVTIRGTSTKTLTDDRGRFTLRAPETTCTLVISYLGHQSITEKFDMNKGDEFHFTLVPTDNLLEEVEVSTGYQTIPKERATGSFVHIDNELLNRSVGSNILDRLDGVTRGLIFNSKNAQLDPTSSTGALALANQPTMSVRGRSTMFSNAEPLIVLDDFPFEGEIADINPENIASVTLLQDASAASIWGARAANGVIVLRSKEGMAGSPPQISVRADVTASEKPDLFYSPTMAMGDYVEHHRYLYAQGAFRGRSSNAFQYIPPVVEALDRHDRGQISPVELEAGLEALKRKDARHELLAHAYRPGLLSRLAFNVSGGSRANRFYLSGGFDGNGAGVKAAHTGRVSLNARNSYRLMGERLGIDAAFFFTRSDGRDVQAPGLAAFQVMYADLADPSGTPLAAGYAYRQSFVDTAGSGLLDGWQYRPLEEMHRSRSIHRRVTYQLQAGMGYKPFDWLSADLKYQYGYGDEDRRREYDASSFAVRDLRNTYAVVDRQAGTMATPVPEGGMLDRWRDGYDQHHLRFQLTADKRIGMRHTVAGIAGMEANSLVGSGQVSGTWLGYRQETESHTHVVYGGLYPRYLGGSSQLIVPNPVPSSGKEINNNLQYFTNLSYSYDRRYTLSVSARRDASNLFGVETNRRGNPFWSVGALWDLGREGFFRAAWVSRLAIRASAGRSGNINKAATALVTSSLSTVMNPWNGQPYQNLNNPPNGRLGWEKVDMYNVALDLAFFDGRITGAVEGFSKHAHGLFSSVPWHPSSGVASFAGNFSSLRTTGWDLNLQSRNLAGALGWVTDLFVSRERDRVTDYRLAPAASTAYFLGVGQYPIVGQPFHAITALRGGGLDAEGDWLGYLDGEPSKDYARIYRETGLDGMVFPGRATPTVFGGFRNSFSHGRLSLSVNLTFKAGYRFRYVDINYSQLLNVNALGQHIFHPGYAERWQGPGDERRTGVPRLRYPVLPAMDAVYGLSETHVYRGDHVRLKDIRIEYRIGVAGKPERLNLYAYASNLGILWRANRLGIDPDVVPSQTMNHPSPRAYALGMEIKL